MQLTQTQQQAITGALQVQWKQLGEKEKQIVSKGSICATSVMVNEKQKYAI